ncbi:uncharacterized protein LOC135124452 isoform X3 [Zophobas morio]|uniref:uncharacterized protein LOC135124452 isoform X3 n=1 Tax=Zophobas morio TaxID=2755281 RepID=UPI003083145C
MFRNVCRLCLGTDDLIWIFSNQMADNMKDIIYVTSGVEISRTDTVTQMVCSTCCQVTIKMYQFRTKSIKNDKDLKARCAGYNIAQLTSAGSTQNNKPDTPSSKSSTPTPPHITIKQVPSIPERYKFAHPSVKEIVKKNPNIKLPNNCLKSHIGAYITLLTDEVDEYFKERNMTDADIAKVKAEAYELAFPKKISVPKKRKKPTQNEKRERTVSPLNNSKRVRLSTDSSDKMSICSDDTTLPGKENLKNTVNETLKRSKEDTHNTSVKIRKVSQTDNGKPKPDEASRKLSDSVSITLKSLLTVEPTKKKASSEEEITLKSILQSQKEQVAVRRVADDNDDIIDVEGPPSPAPSAASCHTPSNKETPRPKSAAQKKSNKTDENGAKTVPDEDFQLFTSRPFLKDGLPKTVIVNGEPVIISDSEDENNEGRDMSDASDPIVFDLDSRSSTNSRYSDADKTTFTEALRLAPKAPDGGNQPDFSLVSVANKTQNLYTCRVCDSQHPSLKELKYHERRTHTKCPFCNKRFRTLANRDEHVSNSCAINRSPVKLKQARLELTRVDELEEITKKYASAFEDFAKSDTEEEKTERTRVEVTNEDIDHSQFTTEEIPRKATSEPKTNEENLSKERKSGGSRKEGDIGKEKEKAGVSEATKPVHKPKKKVNDAPVDCDAATADAISELEQFLNYAEIIPVNDKRSPSGHAKSIHEPISRSDDVICISDEESEENQSAPLEKQPIQENQTTSKEQESEPQDKQPEFQPDMEGSELTINVVNSEILNDINIHDNDFNVLKAILYKNWKRLKAMKKNKENQIKASLKDSPIVDGNSSRMKIFKNLRQFLHKYKIPIEVKYSPTVSVQYKPTTPPPQIRMTGMWSNLVPQQLKPYNVTVPVTNAPTVAKPTAYTVLNGQIGLGMKQMFQTVPVSGAARQAMISNTGPQQLQPQITNVGTVQDSSVTTTNLILSSASSHSLILKGAPTLTTTSAPFTNYIVVQSAAVLPTAQLPTTQGPLPVIESVTSAVDGTTPDQPSLSAVAQLESITNSLMPNSQPTDAVVTVANVNSEIVTVANLSTEVVTVPNVDKQIVVSEVQSTSTTQSAKSTIQPAIRVRNLKELS